MASKSLEASADPMTDTANAHNEDNQLQPETKIKSEPEEVRLLGQAIIKCEPDVPSNMDCKVVIDKLDIRIENSSQNDNNAGVNFTHGYNTRGGTVKIFKKGKIRPKKPKAQRPWKFHFYQGTNNELAYDQFQKPHQLLQKHTLPSPIILSNPIGPDSLQTSSVESTSADFTKEKKNKPSKRPSETLISIDELEKIKNDEMKKFRKIAPGKIGMIQLTSQLDPISPNSIPVNTETGSLTSSLQPIYSQTDSVMVSSMSTGTVSSSLLLPTFSPLPQLTGTPAKPFSPLPQLTGTLTKPFSPLPQMSGTPAKPFQFNSEHMTVFAPYIPPSNIPAVSTPEQPEDLSTSDSISTTVDYVETQNISDPSSTIKMNQLIPTKMNQLIPPPYAIGLGQPIPEMMRMPGVPHLPTLGLPQPTMMRMPGALPPPTVGLAQPMPAMTPMFGTPPIPPIGTMSQPVLTLPGMPGLPPHSTVETAESMADAGDIPAGAIPAPGGYITNAVVITPVTFVTVMGCDQCKKDNVSCPHVPPNAVVGPDGQMLQPIMQQPLAEQQQQQPQPQPVQLHQPQPPQTCIVPHKQNTSRIHPTPTRSSQPKQAQKTVVKQEHIPSSPKYNLDSVVNRMSFDGSYQPRRRRPGDRKTLVHAFEQSAQTKIFSDTSVQMKRELNKTLLRRKWHQLRTEDDTAVESVDLHFRCLVEGGWPKPPPHDKDICPPWVEIGLFISTMSEHLNDLKNMLNYVMMYMPKTPNKHEPMDLLTLYKAISPVPYITKITPCSEFAQDPGKGKINVPEITKDFLDVTSPVPGFTLHVKVSERQLLYIFKRITPPAVSNSTEGGVKQALPNSSDAIGTKPPHPSHEHFDASELKIEPAFTLQNCAPTTNNQSTISIDAAARLQDAESPSRKRYFIDLTDDDDMPAQDLRLPCSHAEFVDMESAPLQHVSPTESEVTQQTTPASAGTASKALFVPLPPAPSDTLQLLRNYRMQQKSATVSKSPLTPQSLDEAKQSGKADKSTDISEVSAKESSKDMTTPVPCVAKLSSCEDTASEDCELKDNSDAQSDDSKSHGDWASHLQHHTDELDLITDKVLHDVTQGVWQDSDVMIMRQSYMTKPQK